MVVDYFAVVVEDGLVMVVDCFAEVVEDNFVMVVEIDLVVIGRGGTRSNLDGDPGQSGRRGGCQNVKAGSVDPEPIRGAEPICTKLCRY